MDEPHWKNMRMRLNDYGRSIPQTLVTHINTPLGRGINFKVDAQIVSLLRKFHRKTFEDLYHQVDKHSQGCEKIHQVNNMPLYMMKIKLFSTT